MFTIADPNSTPRVKTNTVMNIVDKQPCALARRFSGDAGVGTSSASSSQVVLVRRISRSKTAFLRVRIIFRQGTRDERNVVVHFFGWQRDRSHAAADSLRPFEKASQTHELHPTAQGWAHAS